MNDTLKTLIKKYEEPLDFTHPSFSPESVANAESELGVSLPEEYVSFLRESGHGGINGVETIGIGKNGQLLFVEETLTFRQYGLPNNLIVIENCDEWLYCLDVEDGKVVMWSQKNRRLHIHHSTIICLIVYLTQLRIFEYRLFR